MADFSITGEVRLNSDPAEKSTSKWTVAAGQMIADFAKQASSKLAEVVKSGVDYNATMESYLTNFKVMLGSEEAAATKLSEIRKMAASTPFSLDDLTSGTQTLLQFGIAADDTTGVLQRLGDISLGNAEKLQTLTRAYGKMSSAQKVTLENVNMMIDAGFNPLNQICDATGESMSDLYKRISDGKVSFSELEAAVEAATSQGGQFYNGMLEASQTFSGRMSTLKDNVSALTGELTSGLFAALGELVVKLNEVVVSFLDSDEKMAQLKETIGIATAVVAAAGTAFLTYKGYVAAATAIEVVHTAATTAMTAAHQAAEAGATGLAVAQAGLNAVLKANPIGLVVSLLAALAAGLVTAYKTSETFRNAVNSAFASVKKIAQNAIGTVVDWINELVAKIRGAAAALANLKNGVGAAQDAYNAAYNGYMDNYNKRKNAKQWNSSHKDLEWDDDNGWVPKGTSSSGNGSSRAGSQTAVNPYPAITSGAKKASKATKQAAAEVVKSISDTTTEIDGKITRTTENITETLSNGKTQQKQVITETQTEVLNGMLVTVERARTIAADGTESVAETIKRASADSFSGLTKGWQEEAEKGVLGTFDTLVTAVKKQDWQSVGKWVLSTLYNGLAPETKQLIDDTGKALIRQVNGVLQQGVSQLANGAWKLGGQICDGLTSGLGEVVSRFSGLGGTLTDIFSGLKAPLTAAATAISKGLQGGLLSSFPSILASLGSLIGSIGSAFVGMLQAIGAALFPTGFGAPQAILMIAAGAALAATIAAIVASIGGSFKKSAISTGSSGTAGSTVTGASSSLWDYEKTAPLPQRTQRPNIEVNQYIYSKAQTAADLMREAQYEQERAVLQGV